MRDGAAKLLQASKAQKHSMEASKGLFVSNIKILALMRELQRRKAMLEKQETALPDSGRCGRLTDSKDI